VLSASLHGDSLVSAALFHHVVVRTLLRRDLDGLDPLDPPG
jgi:hypothetical protein